MHELSECNGLQTEFTSAILTNTRISDQMRIIIEGAQGTGKTTLAQYLSHTLKGNIVRGFPNSDFIKRSNNQAEICGESFNLTLEPFSSKIKVYDRSPISQFVWMAINTGNDSGCLRCAHEVLELLSKSKLLILFIDSEPDICAMRQYNSSPLAEDLDGLEKQLEIYRYFRSTLEVLIPHAFITSIKNSNIGINEFFDLSLNKVFHFLDKPHLLKKNKK